MNRSLLIVTCLGLSAGACAPPDRDRDADPSSSAPRVAAARSSLVGGNPDSSSDPAIGVFDVSGDDGGQCTAQLIAPTVLLTAAHCVFTENGGLLPATTTYRFATGPDYDAIPDSAWVTIQPSNVHAHPDYNNDSSAHDVAILVLDSPLDATPIPINTQPLGDDIVGQSVRLVGYGATTGTPANEDDDGFGVKRTLTTTVQKVKSDVVLIGKSGKQACSGDSGGPAILTMNGVDTLIAIDDYGDQKIDCTGGDYYRRVDTELDFIQTFLASAGGSASLAAAGGPASSPSSSTADGSAAPSDPSAPDGAKKTGTAHAAAPAASGCSAAGAPATGSRASGWAWLAALGVVLTRARRGGRGGRAALPA